MRRRPDFHRLFRDINIGQLLELVIHARQLLFDVLDRVRNVFFNPRDVEEDATVRTSPALLDLANDATRNVIARQ